MAFITNKNIITETMQRENAKYWSVYEQNGKSLIDENQNEDLTLEESINYLNNILDNLTGLVKVAISKISASEKGKGGAIRQNLNYMLKLQDGQITNGINGFNTAAPASTGGNFTEIKDLMQQQFNLQLLQMQKDFDYKLQLMALERKIEEKESGNEWQKIAIGYLGQMMPSLLGNAPAAPVALAGTDTEEIKPNNNIRATEAIKRLLAIDPNFIDNLEKLADLAEQNPAKYNMAVTMI